MAVTLPPVLITGATSFIGTRLVAALVPETETHILVRTQSDTSAFADEGGPVIHRHDGSSAQILTAFETARPAVVFHLATQYLRTHRPDQIDGLVDANIRFGTHVLEAMTSVGANTLITAGSHFQHYRGDSPLNLYAATKNAFEAVAQYYRDAHGLHDTVVTLYEVYGPDDPRRKIVNVLVAALHSGDVVSTPSIDVELDLVYVDDAVDALVACARGAVARSFPPGSRFSASSSHLVTMSELVTLVEHVGGRAITVDPGGYELPERTIISPAGGDPVPNWAPQVELAEGIRRVLEAIGAS